MYGLLGPPAQGTASPGAGPRIKGRVMFWEPVGPGAGGLGGDMSHVSIGLLLPPREASALGVQKLGDYWETTSSAARGCPLGRPQRHPQVWTLAMRVTVPRTLSGMCHHGQSFRTREACGEPSGHTPFPNPPFGAHLDHSIPASHLPMGSAWGQPAPSSSDRGLLPGSP